MEVILLERVQHLGAMGDVVKVKPGYARNYLMPRSKALRATKENLALFETRRADLEKADLERRTDAEALAQKLDGLRMVMVRQAAETGMLYGSVTARDVTHAIVDQGITIERGQVQLHNPIKELGIYNIDVTPHPEVSVAVEVVVARSEEEAEQQLSKAADMLENPEDAEAAVEEAHEAEEALHADADAEDAPVEEAPAEEEAEEDKAE